MLYANSKTALKDNEIFGRRPIRAGGARAPRWHSSRSREDEYGLHLAEVSVGELSRHLHLRQAGFRLFDCRAGMNREKPKFVIHVSVSNGFFDVVITTKSHGKYLAPRK